jgi:hypothetical protein
VMLEKLQPTLDRAIAGEATCKACGHVWFILCPEVAEPPYECPNCPQNQGYCHPTWKVYCSVKEDLDGAKIWVDGFSRVFSGKTLMEAAIPLKAAIEALCIGDTTLMEAIA